MSRVIAATLTASLLLLGSAARADESSAPAPLPNAIDSQGLGGPVKGDLQFFITTPLLTSQNSASGFYVPHGFGLNVVSQGGQSATEIGFGINPGIGYAITDIFEAGAGLALDVGQVSAGGGSNTTYQFAIEPFVKANFGQAMKVGHHLNPFIFAGLPLGVASGGGSANGVLGLELAGGLEYMLTRNVGLQFFIPLDFIITTSNPSQFTFSTGLQYGLSLYF